MQILPVHVPEESGQAWREAVKVVPDALDEGVGQRLQLSDDEVPVLLHVLGVLRTSLAPEFPETLGRSKPKTGETGELQISGPVSSSQGRQSSP